MVLVVVLGRGGVVVLVYVLDDEGEGCWKLGGVLWWWLY